MKFRKILSLSFAFVLSMALTGSANLLPTENAKDAVKKTAKKPVKSIKPITFSMDTVLVTKDNVSKIAAGQFSPCRNHVSVSYMVLSPELKHLKKWCEEQNNSLRVVTRHEVEHARKAAMVQNVNELPGYRRAQVAIMNECMAPAAEIIEAMTYRIETGRRYPADRAFLFRADSLIMNAQQKRGFSCVGIDFSCPEIADIILDASIDKFMKDYNRGFYHYKVQGELDCKPRPKYTPSLNCDTYNITTFCPAANQWGALWTFDVTPFQDCVTTIKGFGWGGYKFNCANQRVDIWNSASEEARRRALDKVDLCIYQEMGHGRMLRLSTFQKNR